MFFVYIKVKAESIVSYISIKSRRLTVQLLALPCCQIGVEYTVNFMLAEYYNKLIRQKDLWNRSSHSQSPRGNLSPEAATRPVQWKKVFLEILQNPQESPVPVSLF